MDIHVYIFFLKWDLVTRHIEADKIVVKTLIIEVEYFFLFTGSIRADCTEQQGLVGVKMLFC